MDTKWSDMLLHHYLTCTVVTVDEVTGGLKLSVFHPVNFQVMWCDTWFMLSDTSGIACGLHHIVEK